MISNTGRVEMKRMPGNLLDQLDALTARVDELERAMVIPSAEGGLAGVVEASFRVSSIVDNTATDIFRINTTNEDGSADGGGYSCFVQAVVAHAGGPTSSNSAVKSFVAHFGRVVINDGSIGETTAVSEISETASAASTSAQRDVGTVTMTVVENSEYQVDVQMQIDLTGAAVTSASVRVFVRLVYYGFNTAPEMVPL